MKSFHRIGSATFLALALGFACSNVGEPGPDPRIVSSALPIELYHEGKDPAAHQYMEVQDWAWLESELQTHDLSRIARIGATPATGVILSYAAQVPGAECYRDSDCASGLCNEYFKQCVNPGWSETNPSHPLSGTCGVTFVSPSFAVTAAHCVKRCASSTHRGSPLACDGTQYFSHDVALLRCNGRPGERFSFLPLAEQ
jgi:hypothetical protein